MVKRIPRQKRAKEKKIAIIRAASRIIEQGRYHDASTHQIAHLGGVGVGTLYEYFDSKEDVLMAVLEHESDRAWALLEQRLQSWTAQTDSARLHNLLEYVVDFALDHAELVKVMFGQVPSVMHRTSVTRLLSRIETLMSLMILDRAPESAPEVRTADTFIITNGLIGIVLGIANGIPASISRDVLCERIHDIVNKVYPSMS